MTPLIEMKQVIIYSRWRGERMTHIVQILWNPRLGFIRNEIPIRGLLQIDIQVGP